MSSDCCTVNCHNKATHGKMFCDPCFEKLRIETSQRIVGNAPSQVITDGLNTTGNHNRRQSDPSMSEKYPKYYKAIPTGMRDLDIYAVCKIFGVQDASGAIHHAIKKLLLPGVRTGGKSRRDDIKEARDTLNRWLEIHD